MKLLSKNDLLSIAMMFAAWIPTSAVADDWAGLERYAKENQDVMQQPSEQRHVVFMGNSITENWAKMRPQFFSQNGYVGRGISGQTSYQFVLRFRQDVINLRPQLVVINVATNDVAENNYPYDENRTMDNIRSMVELAEANGIKVIMTSTLPAAQFPWRKSITDAADKIARLNQRLRGYAEGRGLPFVDYYSQMVSGPELRLNPQYSKDGVHPTVEGYAVMEPMIKAAIEKALTQ